MPVSTRRPNRDDLGVTNVLDRGEETQPMNDHFLTRLRISALGLTVPLVAAAVPALAPAPAAHAVVTTHYVDASNTDGPWAGTVGDPFQTVAQVEQAMAAGVVSDGDTVLFQKGQSWFDAGNPVLDVTRRVTINQTGAASAAKPGICVAVAVSGVQVNNVRAENCPGPGISFADGTSGGGVNSAVVNGSSGPGIKVQGSSTVLYGTTFTGNSGPSIDVTGARGTVLIRNRSTDRWFLNVQNASSTDTTVGVEVRYNEHRSGLASAQFALVNGTAHAAGAAGGVRFLNNTAHLTGASSRGVVCTNGCSSTVLQQLVGNVLSATGTPFATDGVTGQDNIFWGSRPTRTGSTWYPYGPGEEYADPRFVNAAGGDLRLADGSPAIDRVDPSPYSSAAIYDLAGVQVWNGAQRLALVDGNGNGTPRIDAGARERAAAARTCPLLGTYVHWDQATDVTITQAAYGALPQIASTYLGADEPWNSARLAALTKRIQRGTGLSITLSTRNSHPNSVPAPIDRSDYIAVLGDAAHPRHSAAVAWLQQYVDGLGTLAAVNPAVPVHATLEHEYEIKVAKGDITGASALNENYARALTIFFDLVRAKNATLAGGARIRTVYWISGWNRASEGDVGNRLTTLPDVVGMDPYATPANRRLSLTATMAERLPWVRSQDSWYVDQPIVLPEFGMDVRLSDPVTETALVDYYSGIRAEMAALGLSWGVMFGGSGPFDTRLLNRPDGAVYDLTNAALGAELRNRNVC